MGRKREWSARSYGRYSYRIALPENIEFEKIKAEVKDGVLYITIAKPSSPGKTLDINVE
jgi:HSP20 family protein